MTELSPLPAGSAGRLRSDYSAKTIVAAVLKHCKTAKEQNRSFLGPKKTGGK